MEKKILLNEVFETIGVGIFITDLKGTLIEVNKNLTDMLGYRKNELLGKHLLDISQHHSPKFSFENPTPMINKILTEGSVKNHEIKYVKKDGSFFDGEVNINIWKDDGGNITNYIATLHDISERKSWEQKIEEKEEFLRKIIHADPNLIFVKHRNGKYVEISEAVGELFGASSDYVIGKTDLELVNKRKLTIDEAKKLRSDDMEVLDTGKHKFIEEESITQTDGKIKWFQTTKVPLVINNKADYVLGLAVDITLRKKNIDLMIEKENELKTKNKNLEEMNTSLKVLIKQNANNHLEIERNLLSSIKILTEPYLEKLNKICSNSKQKNLVEIIKNNLNEVVSPFSNQLSNELSNLTSNEVRFSYLIKNGNSNKEIAVLIGVSPVTVCAHRRNIRKKLGITNSKKNLGTYLKSIP
jgi:two-component system sensor histidine kinase/response regulator